MRFFMWLMRPLRAVTRMVLRRRAEEPVKVRKTTAHGTDHSQERETEEAQRNIYPLW
jgi:hypothetical protein